MREKKARHEVMTEQKGQYFENYQREVEQIRSKAFRLSEQLVEINHI